MDSDIVDDDGAAVFRPDAANLDTESAADNGDNYKVDALDVIGPSDMAQVFALSANNEDVAFQWVSSVLYASDVTLYYSATLLVMSASSA